MLYYSPSSGSWMCQNDYYKSRTLTVGVTHLGTSTHNCSLTSSTKMYPLGNWYWIFFWIVQKIVNSLISIAFILTKFWKLYWKISHFVYIYLRLFISVLLWHIYRNCARKLGNNFEKCPPTSHFKKLYIQLLIEGKATFS